MPIIDTNDILNKESTFPDFSLTWIKSIQDSPTFPGFPWLLVKMACLPGFSGFPGSVRTLLTTFIVLNRLCHLRPLTLTFLCQNLYNPIYRQRYTQSCIFLVFHFQQVSVELFWLSFWNLWPNAAKTPIWPTVICLRIVTTDL